MNRENKTLEERKERQPFGIRRMTMTLDKKTLDLIKREGLVPRWINDNDNGNRIQNAIDGGYNFISSDGNVIVGDTIKKEDSGRRIKKRVGTHDKSGEPMFAYLMAIKKEFYEEDQARKEEINNQVDIAIKGGNPRGLSSHGIKPEHGSTQIKNISYQP